MSISIDQWRASIGLFYGQVYGHVSIKLSRGCCNFKMVAFILCFYAVFAFLLLLKHGDVEINPGPKKKETTFFSCLHRNINSILAHNKLTLLQAYNTIHQYDILCISETYLDSFISNDDTPLSLPGYNLARSDHPGNVKRGGVCLYYKEKLSLRMINVSFLSQCVLCEVTPQRQKGYVIVIYRSPSQTAVEFDEFLSNLEKLLNFVKQSQPSFTIILGDFNARSKSWWPDNITSPEGTDINSLATVHGLQQLISEPTHLLPNSLSCIDLIFTDQPNLVVDSGVHHSLHPNCHHQIILCKFNLMIEYPPHMNV